MQTTWSLLVGLLLFSFAGCGVVVTDEMPTANGTQPENGSPDSDTESHGAVTITEDSFQKDVLENPRVVMVDCWAPWCGPCVQLAPVVEEIAGEFQDRAVVGKLNVDNAPTLAQNYNVTGIPALLFFRNGQLIDTMVGLQPKENIVAKLNELIGG